MILDSPLILSFAISSLFCVSLLTDQSASIVLFQPDAGFQLLFPIFYALMCVSRRAFATILPSCIFVSVSWNCLP